MAIIGYNTTVELETLAGATTFDELGEVTNITPPGDSVDQVDVTHYKSPNRRREYISGLIDGGEGTIEINWTPGNLTDQKVNAWKAIGDTRQMRFTWPNGEIEEFPVTYVSFERTAPVDDKLTGTLTVKLAGDVVFSS